MDFCLKNILGHKIVLADKVLGFYQISSDKDKVSENGKAFS
jgi:hypothetical protein